MDLTPQSEKLALRQRLRAALKAMSQEQRNAEGGRALEVLRVHPRFQRAQTLMLFHSLPDEVCTHALVDQLALEGRTVLLPVCQGDDLVLRRYEGQGLLSQGSFHIEEPQGADFTDYQQIDLAVVPGVAFDKAGHRMGRGRGYYDRFFAHPALCNVYKIGLCYPCQLVEHVPVEVHDQTMDCVVCG